METIEFVTIWITDRPFTVPSFCLK